MSHAPRASGRPVTPGRVAFLVGILALGVNLNSLGNGFAYDDTGIVADNPVVHRGDVGEILSEPYWPNAKEPGLYRPVTTLTLAAQWAAWGNVPQAFHMVNVLLHVAVSLAVLALLLHFFPPVPAAAGAALFAVHPVHVEAVANVVGQSELLAAGFTLLACLLFLKVKEGGAARRGLRTAAIGGAYLLALGSKEIAATLPALLLVLAWLEYAGSDRPLRRLVERFRSELPLFLLLTVCLASFLVIRGWVLEGSHAARPAPSLIGLTVGERLLTAVQLWTEYARLLLVPVELAVNYAPGMIFPARSFNAEVLAGALVGAAALALVVGARREAPGLSAGVLWTVVALLPVSQILFPIGTVLAERTLYLPSVGVVLCAGALGLLMAEKGRATARAALAACALVVLAFSVRTVTRNPVWFNTFTAMEAHAREHPRSYLSHRVRAWGLQRVGEIDAALAAHEAALALDPTRQPVLVELAQLYGRQRRWAEAEALLRRALEIDPNVAPPYRHLASQLILQGRAREGHRVALEGLARAETDAELWRLVSEAYVARGDMDAAARARRAALGQEPGSRDDWMRLAEILEAGGRGDEAARARIRARALGPAPPDSSAGRTP